MKGYLYQSAISCSKYASTPLPFFLKDSSLEDFLIMIDEVAQAIDRENKAITESTKNGHR